jgi:hypothetical protein
MGSHDSAAYLQIEPSPVPGRSLTGDGDAPRCPRRGPFQGPRLRHPRYDGVRRPRAKAAQAMRELVPVWHSTVNLRCRNGTTSVD